MHIIVKGKQLDVGESLRTHVETTLTGLVEKYFSNPLEATVVLSREAHLYKADIQAHVGRGIILQAYAEATEPYPAFDDAAERVAKRLRRYKRRLRDHHQREQADAAVPARKYIINADAHDDEADDGVNAPAADGHAVNGNGADHHPMIIAEMQTNIDMLTVSEAVMRMDLAELPALLFRNRAHGQLNMVYRRPDGNVGWVDPSDGKSVAAH